MKKIVLIIALFVLGCTPQQEKTSEPDVINKVKSTKQIPYFKYQKENLFPGDGSLLRAEDGVGLEDGRVIVVDQATGLRLIEKDGSNRPFGNFEAVGFVHLPPEQIAGPNGMVLEHGGEHILMSDAADGKIYRINVATEEVEMIYNHPYGVNTVYRDKTGAIWFSQSAKSTNLGELFQDVNLPAPHGAVFRMEDLRSAPAKVLDSLYLANGITMDKDEKHLFVAETMMDRVHLYEVDTNSGFVKHIGIAANIRTPDNILIDKEGRLIIASPVNNQVVLVDFENHSQHVIFDGSTKDNQKYTNEWNRRSHLGMERLEVLTPELTYPLPGLITGMFFSNDGRTLYITNLGNDLLKYDFK